MLDGAGPDKECLLHCGIPLASETLRALKADSEETGVSISPILAVRVADWYRYTRELKSAAPLQADPDLREGEGPCQRLRS